MDRHSLAAERCVIALQASDDLQNIFNKSINSTVTTNITAILQNAAFLEDLVARSATLRNISFTIIAHITCLSDDRPPQSTNDIDLILKRGHPSYHQPHPHKRLIDDHTFEIESRLPAHSPSSPTHSHPHHSSSHNPSHHPSRSPSQTPDHHSSPRHSAPPSPTPPAPSTVTATVRRPSPPPTTSSGPPATSSIPRAPSPPTTPAHIIPIPASTASRCLSLLLDGSGHTTHASASQVSHYRYLRSRLFREPIRRIFTAMDQHGRTAATSSTTPVRSGHVLRYLDLLPETTSQNTHVTFPILELSGTRAFEDCMRTVRLSGQKPDRLSKDEAFAFLCVLLHHQRHLAAATVLEKFAREGLSRIGCTRRTALSRSPAARCGGPERCRQMAEPTVRLECRRTRSTSAPRRPFATARVFPLVRCLAGRPVPTDRVAVLVCGVEPNARVDVDGIELPGTRGTAQERNVRSSVMLTWPCALVRRVLLAVEGDGVVGDAIFVEALDWTTGAGCKRPRLAGETEEGMENDEDGVSECVVVCDVHIRHVGRRESAKYGFGEWYNLPQFIKLRRMHFADGLPPQALTDVQGDNTLALLWDKRFVLFEGAPDDLG